jgi:ssDNA-binding Zn-finger/Zn-ribbon topoisomerase 1
MTTENVKCPDCDGDMVSRTGKYGTFWGCKDYPKCKGTRDSMGRSKAERDAERDKDSRIGENEASADDMQLPSGKILQNDKYRFNKQ